MRKRGTSIWPEVFYPERGEKSGDTYLENIWKFTNYACNVGNYITPARNA